MKQVAAVLLVLVLVFLCLSMPAVAESSDVRDFGDYKVRIRPDGTALLVEYTGDSSDLTVPDSFGGAPLTAIGANAFDHKKKLFFVELPDTVVEIGDYAFLYCESLSDIVQPGGNRQEPLRCLRIPE